MRCRPHPVELLVVTLGLGGSVALIWFPGRGEPRNLPVIPLPDRARPWWAFARADGTVLEVEGDRLRIDLGRTDGLVPGLRFQVCHLYRRGPPSRGPFRVAEKTSGPAEWDRTPLRASVLFTITAMIEVVAVEESTSWCMDLGARRVVNGDPYALFDLRQRIRPPAPGDHVRSPLFHRNEQTEIVFLGDTAQGPYSRERLADWLVSFGVRVAPRISEETCFVVRLGDLNAIELADQQLACEIGVVFLSESELLDYLP